MLNWHKYRSEQEKKKRSEKASRAARKRWDDYHASIPKPNYQELPDDIFEITVKNLISNKTNVMLFHPDRSRRGRFHIDVNGEYWKTCGWTEALVRIRKSCKRTPLYVLD